MIQKTLQLLSALILSLPLGAQTYQVGDTVADYSLTDFRTGESVDLYDLGQDGGILVLEWFAWWCPFCARAAANVESGIVGHYASMGGTNPNGVPVQHISLNVQGNARENSMTFINKYNLGTVLEDYNRDFFGLFNEGGGQPLFVILNAEPNSPSAAQWEVLYTRLNYFTNEAPDISALMRPAIDSIEPGEVTSPVEALFPGIGPAVDGWYESDWFGWFFEVEYPLVNHLEFGYGFLADAPGPDSLYFYNLELGWLFTNEAFYPYLYSHSNDNWLLYQLGSMGEWYYDYNSMDWRTAMDLGKGFQ